MGKKKKKKIEIGQTENWKIAKKIRKVWLINPKTRVKPNKKVYNRGKAKEEFRKILKEEGC